jgi:hypothetical protein
VRTPLPPAPPVEVEVDLGDELDVPPTERGATSPRQPSERERRDADRPPIIIGPRPDEANHDNGGDGDDDGEDDGGDESRARSDEDAFVIRPRISAKQASELAFADERPDVRSRLRAASTDILAGPPALSPAGY